MAIQSAIGLNTHLQPLCPRDDHAMKFESAGSRANTGLQASYHCGSGGCCVRYNSLEGYFTLMGSSGQTYTVEEPGVNTMECPVHGHWLYRQKNSDTEAGVRWRCGILGCDYSQESKTKGAWVRT
jgi:hypothetical protein